MAGDHIHLPLVKDRNEIRVLNIHPSQDFTAPITCDIRIVSLDDDPVFDALSWCWGSVEDTAKIVVGGNSFSCRQNLDSALRHLRDKVECITLWVDAVCINQGDLGEKSSQILLMSRIYGHAHTVRIWLGEAADDSSEAVRVVKQLQMQPDLKSVKLDGQELSAEQLWAFTSLCKRPWFKRIWVVQEYALARQAVFYCGFDRFSWTNIRNFVLGSINNLVTNSNRPLDEGYSLTISSSVIDAISSLIHLGDVSDMTSEGKQHDIFPLETFLALSRLNATDPRDKVYGCLGLLPGFEELIIIDYNSPVEVVYAETTYALFCQMKCFEPLCYTSTKRETVSLELPSWSLDFSHDLNKGPVLFDHFSAAGEWGSWTAPRLVYPLLWIRSTFFDEIVSTHHIVPDTKADHWSGVDVSMQRFLHTGWRSFFGLDLDTTAHEAYVGGGSMENAYWRTVVCDLFTNNAFRGWSRIQRKDINSFLKWIRNTRTGIEHWNPDAEIYLIATHAVNIQQNAYLFCTKRGFIGISAGPSDIQAGDQLHFIHRGNVPFALRPVQHDNQDSVYELVNECYVHGIMDGEAFREPPLPHSRSFRQHELRRQLFGGQPLDRNFPVGDWQDIALT
ncbi:hypothetical protein G7Y79_00007g022720 [Physcia stellaris]|nr:hypothetical protein G7Y79_00007g022720 [Physcia stellaris]